MSLSFNSRLIIFVAIMASLLEIIDSAIVNVAIPSIMGNLGCTLDEVSLVITSYTVANAIILPISAWLGQRFGLKNYYLSCITVFTISSVACGFSPNLTTLVFFRILQGLAGGALLPTSQALIYQQFPKEKAGIAGAIFGMSVMLGPALGPVIGGYLTDNFGWRSIFNVNLPVGVLTLCVGMICIKNKEEIINKAREKLDYFGLLLLVLGVGGLQFFLERGQANDWFNSHLIITIGVITAISLVLFIWWEGKVKNPLINISLFKQRTVLCGVSLMAYLGFFLYGLVFILPVFIQTMFHFTATQTGLLFIPGSILTALLMPLVGKKLQSISDTRILIAIGIMSIEGCLYLTSHFSSRTTYAELLNMLFVRGFALAFLFIPINSSIISQYSGYEMGQVAGLLNLFRQIGGSIGIALINTVFSRSIDKNYHHLIEKVSLLNSNAQNIYYSGIINLQTKIPRDIGFAQFSDAMLQILYNRVHAQAFILSFIEIMIFMSVIFIFSLIPLYFLRGRKI